MTIAWDHTTKPSTCRVLDEQGRERLRGTYNQCAEYITETLATKAAGTAVAVWRKRVEELEGALQAMYSAWNNAPLGLDISEDKLSAMRLAETALVGQAQMPAPSGVYAYPPTAYYALKACGVDTLPPAFRSSL